jgi:hypothetical protein
MPILQNVESKSQSQILFDFLARFSDVQECGGSFRATCPAHEDRNPSLSIKLGDRGILIRCWAGCSLSEICQAIGLSESELFFDHPAAQSYKNNGTRFQKANLHWRWDWKRQTGDMLAITSARSIVAEEFLSQAQALDLNTLTDQQRIRLQQNIALASSWIRLHESAEALCHAIAQRQRQQEVSNG